MPDTAVAVDVTLDLSEVQQLEGKDLPQPEQLNYEVSRDSIRHVAYAMDDYNALYLDVEFARQTRWGGIIAPPGYLYSHGNTGAWIRGLGTIRDSDGLTLDLRDNMGDEWEFLLPVRPGDVVTSRATLLRTVPKKGARMGVFALNEAEVRYVNQRGELVAVCRGASARWSSERQRRLGQLGAAYSGTPKGLVPPAPVEATLSPADLSIRPMVPVTQGPPRRYDRHTVSFEDVAEGATIDELAIPLTSTHTRRWESIATWHFRGDDGGNIVAGGHVPSMYAAGMMRIPWFGTLLTRWAGPNCWVRRLSHRSREWALVGRTYYARGTVTGKRIEDGRHYLVCELRMESEEGILTNTGSALLEVPSRA